MPIQRYKQMRKIIILITLYSSIHLSAQNLVQNPGFEDSLNIWWYSSDIPSATQFIIDHSEMHTDLSPTFELDPKNYTVLKINFWQKHLKHLAINLFYIILRF